MRKFISISILLLIITVFFTKNSYGQVTVSGSNGQDGTYFYLSNASGAFAALNGASQAGKTITITITSDATNENGANALTGAVGMWTSLTIIPSGARTISGAVAGPVIDLSAVSNVTINGINSGGNSLTIANTTNSGSNQCAIRFINDASNNTITNCSISAIPPSTTCGVVFFSTGIVTGNSNNTISYCNINGNGAANNGIYSAGTSAAIANSGNTISNNNIYDYFNNTSATVGINLTTTGNTGWTITGNKLYQTATRLFTTAATHNGIYIGSGSGYTITNNIIGFANSSGTGTTNLVGNTVSLTGTFPSAYTTTGTPNATRYVAINTAFTAGGAVSNIQGNTIAGFALYTSSGANSTYGIWCGIEVQSGNVNIGTTTGNIIGVSSGNSSIYAACTTTGGTIVGIYATSANTVAIQNNTFGGIDASGTSATISAGFTGIDIAGIGNFTINGNTIGNTTTANIRTGYFVTSSNLTNATGTATSTTGATSAIIGVRSAMTGNYLSISNNTLRGFLTSGTVTSFSGITSSGTMTTLTPSVIINNNHLGTSSVGLVTYMFANSGALFGINLTNTIATIDSISNNDITGITHTVLGSSIHTYINYTGGTAQYNSSSITGNTFTNLNVNTTANIYFVNLSYTELGIQNINNNSIVGTFNKGGAGGSIFIVYPGSAASPSSAVESFMNNNFSNITMSTGSGSIYGYYSLDGLSNTSIATKTITGNTFNNWTSGSTGASYGFYLGYIGGSPGSISNNTISNISCQGAFTGIYVTSSGNAASVFNISINTINSISSTGTGGAVTGIYCSNSSTLININGNTINNLSSTAVSGAVIGITIPGAMTTNVYNNTINTLSCSGTTAPIVSGLIVTAGTNVNVYKNKIYDISVSGAITTKSPAINGMLFSGGTNVTAYNNLIGDLRAPLASLTEAIRGISVTSSSVNTSYNVYYNTVYITGSGGTNFGTTCIYDTASASATTAKLDLRNNILVNNCTPSGTGLTVAYRRSPGTATMLANYASTSNNNLFYAGTSGASNLIFSDGTSIAQTMSAYKSGVFTAGNIASRDAYSVSENPNFQSTTGSSANFLKFSIAVATQIESNASNIVTPVNITDDFAGTIRQGHAGYTGSGTQPDLGAWELDGVINDLTAPVITYTSLPNTSLLTNRTIIATITDATGVQTAGSLQPRIYYKKNSGTYYFQQGILTSGNATYGTWSFQIVTADMGGVTTNDVVSYYIIAQDIVSTPNIGSYPSGVTATDVNTIITSPATPYTYTVIGGFSGTYNVGTGQTYTSLTNTGGFFAVINSAVVTGNIVVNITSDITETGANSLNQWIEDGTGGYTLTIQPDATTLRTLTGAYAGALINFNGADRVTVDGSSGGISHNLTFSNTSTTGTAFTFINDATYNTIKYCNITGENSAATGGIISFSTTTGTTGNDYNTISNCNIYNATGGNSYVGIYASGTVGKENDNITIQNNNIYDYYNSAGAYGISVAAGNTAWTISGNSFYETAARTIAGTFIGIYISNATGNGFNINGNYIGGQAPNCGGSPLTLSSAAVVLEPITLNVGTTTTTRVNGNTISNISMTTTSTSAYQMPIYLIGGQFEIGTTTGNIIGSQTSTGSITVSTTATGTTFSAIAMGYGGTADIFGTVNISNNLIGGISLLGAGQMSLRGIDPGSYATAPSGTLTINNNTIGSSSTLLSISNATYGNTFGIIQRNTFAGPNQSITNNTIANLAQTYSSSTNNPTIRGLYCGSGVTNATGNTIYNITSAAPNVGVGVAASVIGIYAPAITSSLPQTLSQNNVYNIYNTNTNATAATTAIGICVTGWVAPSSGINLVSGNRVRSVYVTNATGNAQGLNIVTSNSTNYQNNDIELGLDNSNNPITSLLAFQGIAEGTNNNNFYFNTVRVTGSGVSGTTPSTYAFNSTSITDIIKNNIFVNDRSGGTTGNHYAISVLSGNAMNYNDYYVNGTGTILGYNASGNVTSLPILFGQDANSVSVAPGFTSTTNLQLINSPILGLGVTIPGITTDFLGVTRFNPPTMGAYESIPPCVAPAFQPTVLVLTPATTTVSGSFTATTSSPAADHYLIVRNTSGIAPIPANGTIYSASSQLSGSTFVAYQTSISFTDAGLNGNTQYYYYIYAAKTTSCLNGPAYLTSSPLTNNVTTNCATPSSQPTGLTLASGSTTVSGSFTPETSADHYLIIRSTSNTLSAVPLNGQIYNANDQLGGGNVLGYQTGTSISDINLYSGIQYYYFVFAANSICSGGPAYLSTLPLTGNTTTLPPPVTNKTLKVTAMLQEYFNSNTGLMNQTLGINWNTGDLFKNFSGTTVDTVMVLIRKTNITADVVSSFSIDTVFYGVKLNNNGLITISLSAGITGYHYIEIKHRNSIETWSDSVNFSTDTVKYDFYNYISQFALDNGMLQDGTHAWIWGGDVNQNGNLESEDATIIYVAANSDDPTVNNGYVICDIDGNGNLDSQDYGLAYNNANIGANIINPFSYLKKK